jgi:DNA-binding transcriptional LysR family regulator
MRIDALFLSYGVRLKTHIEAHTAVSACAFVAAGAGFTLVDAISAWGYPGAGVVYKPFYPSIDTDFALVTSLGRRHPSGESFVTHLRNFASSKIGPRISHM